MAPDRELFIIIGMICPRPNRWLLFLGLCFLVRLSFADWDTGKEMAIADKLSAQLEYGEIVWLQTDKSSEFPAIYTLPVYNNKDRAVILLHGMSAHMDWPVVISPLREFFRDRMWASLSVQLPVITTGNSPAEYSKTLDEASRRIQSSIHYLKDQGYGTLVLAGYGFGATTAAYFLTNGHTQDIHAFVGISMLARKFLAPQVNLLDYLEKLYLPVLDIYGSNDLPVIIRTADDRRLFAQKNGADRFSQIMVEGADHYYTGHEQTLFNNIISWLQALDAGGNKEQDNQVVQHGSATSN